MTSPNPRRMSYSQCRRLAKEYFGVLIRFWRIETPEGQRIQLGFEEGKKKTPLAIGRDYQEALDYAVTGMAQLLKARAADKNPRVDGEALPAEATPTATEEQTPTVDASVVESVQPVAE